MIEQMQTPITPEVKPITHKRINKIEIRFESDESTTAILEYVHGRVEDGKFVAAGDIERVTAGDLPEAISSRLSALAQHISTRDGERKAAEAQAKALLEQARTAQAAADQLIQGRRV